MKRFLFLAIFVCAGACALQAQVVDTTVCDVLKNPASFNGKIVRIKGTVSAGLDQFMIRGPECGQQVDSIWLAYPEGTKGKAGPDAMVEVQPARNFAGKYTAPARTPVKLEKDKAFKQFDSLLAEVHKGPYMCLGCRRYQVTATLVGRLDGVADASLQRDGSGKIIGFGGFGNMNVYPARLVLQSISDVTPKEIDYSKADALAKGNMPPPQPPGGLYDPLATARTAATAIGNSQAGIQAQKDIEVFGKKGENNGVYIGYGTMNEASEKSEALGTHDSPDGVLYNCTFNMNHLQGLAMAAAILHIGQHVSELRNPGPDDAGTPPIIREANAWAVTISAAMGMREKFLMLPGGSVAWNWKWAQADISSNFQSAMTSYFADEALMNR
jgi:opacity protein-like surface antigen